MGYNGPWYIFIFYFVYSICKFWLNLKNENWFLSMIFLTLPNFVFLFKFIYFKTKNWYVLYWKMKNENHFFVGDPLVCFSRKNNFTDQNNEIIDESVNHFKVLLCFYIFFTSQNLHFRGSSLNNRFLRKLYNFTVPICMKSVKFFLSFFFI